MRLNAHVLILCSILCIPIAGATCPVDSDGESRKAFDAGDSSAGQSVPFSRILARPEEFDRKRILLHGVIAQDGSGFSLYLDSEAMKFGILPSAINLELTDSLKLIACRNDKSYVLVQGIFTYSSPGLQEGVVRRTGTLKMITRLMPLHSRLGK
jgi:hypothetical protein